MTCRADSVPARGLTAADLSLLATLIDVIVPADVYPSGCQAGVLEFFVVQFQGDLAPLVPRYRQGLAALDAEARAAHAQPFTRLPFAIQTELLQGLERGHARSSWPLDPAWFFADVVCHTMEGFYGNPSNGGNRGGIAWQMIGFEVTD